MKCSMRPSYQNLRNSTVSPVYEVITELHGGMILIQQLQSQIWPLNVVGLSNTVQELATLLNYIT